MKKTHAKTRLRRLPLDALRGFEASARTASFSQAAAELALTQSAISRQVQALEQALGVALFRRYNRRIELTEAGHTLHRASGAALAELESALARIGADDEAPVVSVTTSVSFASLWLVPRLAEFRAAHPGIDIRIAANDELVALERGRIDCAVRFCEPEAAPAGAIPLAAEAAFPVASPALLRDRARPLREPADLRHHVLIDFVDPQGRVTWLSWAQWLAAWKLRDLRPAGVLTFSHYDQAIQAAVEGEGVAIGRTPHCSRLLRSRRLVVPFAERLAAPRRHYLIVSRLARSRPEVRTFAQWVQRESAEPVTP